MHGVAESAYQEEGELQAFRVACWSEDWLHYMNAQQRHFYTLQKDRLVRLIILSKELWVVYCKREPVMFIGLVPYSLIGSHTYLWTINFREFCWLHLRDLKRLLEKNMHRFDVLTARVLDGKGRLARFCGFEFSHTESGDAVYARRK